MKKVHVIVRHSLQLHAPFFETKGLLHGVQLSLYKINELIKLSY
ncbi:hypothetical protein BWGOE2_30560 [Bacillus mycoides]|nr:hypothetical protein [Bacillus mycoides]OFD41322.1 hypothetical protein BWGOE2_30560 [Bacillus mycoides]OFD45499.1 hypothetical protein BWGOE1_29770 [Bacillus mycoides]